MKKLSVGACVLLITSLIVAPAWAQRGVSGDSGGGRAVTSGSTSVSTVTYSSSDSGSVSYSPSSSYSTGMGNRAFVTSGVTPSYNTPVLTGTSFCTTSSYRDWNDYYSYLLHYSNNFNTLYFSRFMRNMEPLVTPEMLKATMNEPLVLSRQMLKAIDQLEAMLADARNGNTVDRAAITRKSQLIREYAKAIRQNRTIGLIDIRENTDVLKGEDIDALSPEAMAKLREMALDVNRQLTDLYSTASSSTISVDSYQEASFESMTKGIEKVCKAIERSSKRL